MQFRHSPFQRQFQPYNQQPMQQQFYSTPQAPYQAMYPYQQPQTPFEQFAKPQQPADWYNTNQQNQTYNQQAYGNPSQGAMSQFQDENGQLNLDKVLTTVSQFANTYHQVSPIIKQFGSFMKTFR
ncbi:YppG family protein [Ornithinibacillus xuwenensis]|jgi:YppG-like protein|uniref:YppG family protein n=1 Tax=Ornithinibacillus xuwenensis TaxID=3144668 RepID=A0ABU9XLS4_9BACI